MVKRFVVLLLRPFTKQNSNYMPEKLLTINDPIVVTFDRSYKDYTLDGLNVDGQQEEITVHAGERYKIAWKDDRDRPYGFQKNAGYVVQEILVAEDGTVYFKFQQFNVLHDVSKLQIQLLPL